MTPRGWRTAWRIILLAMIVVIAGTAITGYVAHSRARVPSIDAVRSQLLPHLRPGIDRADAQKFLAEDPLGIGSRWEYAGYDPRENTICGVVIGSSSGFFVRSDVEIKCFFDQRGNLTKTRIRELHVGP
jgi:hypothetical protein